MTISTWFTELIGVLDINIFYKLQRFHFLERLGRGENIGLLPRNEILKISRLI